MVGALANRFGDCRGGKVLLIRPAVVGLFVLLVAALVFALTQPAPGVCFDCGEVPTCLNTPGCPPGCECFEGACYPAAVR